MQLKIDSDSTRRNPRHWICRSSPGSVWLVQLPELAYNPGMSESDHLKPLEWVGSSLKDLRSFPAAVRRDMGTALLLAQKGGKADSAVPLKGYGGAGVLEVIEDHRGDTFRAVYTVRYSTAVFVLHAFVKKSKSGRETPKADMDLINRRLGLADSLHKARLKGAP